MYMCTAPPPQGALLAFECLSEKLGKLFEPYIIYILPLLLACFGDVVPAVRQATEEAARMIMGQLTASGEGGGGMVWGERMKGRCGPGQPAAKVVLSVRPNPPFPHTPPPHTPHFQV